MHHSKPRKLTWDEHAAFNVYVAVDKARKYVGQGLQDAFSQLVDLADLPIFHKQFYRVNRSKSRINKITGDAK
jgi:hypothetical protein